MASKDPKISLDQVKRLAARSSQAPDIYQENEADIILANYLGIPPPARLIKPQPTTRPAKPRRTRTSLAWQAARITTKDTGDHHDD